MFLFTEYLVKELFLISLVIYLRNIFTAFGDNELSKLLDHFTEVLEHSAGVDTAEAEVEWCYIKKHVHDM